MRLLMKTLLNFLLLTFLSLNVSYAQVNNPVLDTDTNASTICSGTTTYLDGEGNCDDISSVYEPAGITESDISDLVHYTTENAQDDVGGVCIDSSEINFTYSDITPSITASIVTSSIDETKLDASTNASLDLADSSLQSSHIGTSVEAFDSDLSAIAGLSSTGMIARTGAGTASVRTITGTVNEITVTNGNGVSGNPTLALGSSIATYAPSYAALGSMTYTSVTTTKARWQQIGKIVHVWVHCSGTTGGSADASILISLPTTAATGATTGGGGYIIDSSTYAPQLYMYSTTQVGVKKHDGANWGLGANRQIQIYFTYEAA